jgi:glucose-1-phosphate adenylyltransferase
VHLFEGYWQDIGTMRSFHEANLRLAAELPPFNFYEPDAPIYTHPRFLPSSKINHAYVRNSALSEGSIVVNAEIEESIVGVRSIIGEHAVVRRSVIMGADYYETDEDRAINQQIHRPNVGIGANCVIENAIVDKNARIGEGSRIVNVRNVSDERHEDYVITEGIVVIPKDAVIPPGTVI